VQLRLAAISPHRRPNLDDKTDYSNNRANNGGDL
jgi:hypothetical protein